jgi:hypothetical protein
MARTKGKIPAEPGPLAFERYAKESRVGFQKYASADLKIDLKEMVVGMGCCVSLGKLHLFLMAPDADRLAEALEELKITEDERSHPDVSLVALYPATEQKHQGYPSASKSDEEVQAWKDGLKIIWAYHEPSDVVAMIWVKDLGTDLFVELGPAVKKTALEAKLLMRAAGWNVEDIKAVDINDQDDPDNEIPF